MSIPMLNLPLKTAKPAHRLRKGKVKVGLGVGVLQFRTETPRTHEQQLLSRRLQEQAFC